MDFFQEWGEALGIRPLEWDWGSFGWGMLAGTIVTVAGCEEVSDG